MTDRRRVTVGRVMAAVAATGTVAGLAWLLALGYRGALWTDWIVHNGIIAIGSAVITWLVLPSQPRNKAVWVLAWAGVLTGLEVVSYAVVAQLLDVLNIDTPNLDLVPADLPTHVALVVQQMNWLWLGVMAVLLVLPLFPDGRTPSPRWIPVVWAQLAVLAMSAIGLMWEARPSGVRPIRETQDLAGGFRSVGAAMVTVGYPLILPVSAALGTVALLVRYRNSSSDERQQIRWVALGASLLGALMVVAFLVDEAAGRLDVALVVGAVGMVAILGSIGVAIGRYRLYDVDVVISRSFVFGSLALFITGAYVAVVVGVGNLLDIEQSSPMLEIIATALVAIAFQPLRRRLQRVANRIAFGRRATPYEVLSEFSRRVAATDEAVLTDIARSLVEGTSAGHAAIWTGRPGNRSVVASWPAVSAGNVTLEQPIIHAGEELGAVALTAGPAQRLGAADERLAGEVAAGLGLVLHNMQLTDVLRQQVEELRGSRRRIVAVRDETRRTLERNLHDGAQQQLVAIKVKLGIARQLAFRAGAEQTAAVIESIAARTDAAIEAMRDFARGIYPPLLEAEGLGAALSAQVRKLATPVVLTADGFGRHARPLESTLYFCAVDLLGRAGSGDVDLRLVDTGTTSGFELTQRLDSSGSEDLSLTDVVDRIDAAGGTLRIHSDEETRTIEVSLPETVQ